MTKEKVLLVVAMQHGKVKVESGTRLIGQEDGNILEGIDHAIIWYGEDADVCISPPVVISPDGGWLINRENGEFNLVDKFNKRLSIPYGSFHEAIHFESLQAWYSATSENEIAALRAQNEQLQNQLRMEKSKFVHLQTIIGEIFDLNNKGGSGSRKTVREIIESAGFTPCPNCGKMNCECHSR